MTDENTAIVRLLMAFEKHPPHHLARRWELHGVLVDELRAIIGPDADDPEMYYDYRVRPEHVPYLQRFVADLIDLEKYDNLVGCRSSASSTSPSEVSGDADSEDGLPPEPTYELDRTFTLVAYEKEDPAALVAREPLAGISLDELSRILGDPKDDWPELRKRHPINERQASYLRHFVQGGIDLDRYDYFVEPDE